MAYIVRQKKRVANTVRELLQVYPGAVNVRNERNFTPLFLAIHRHGCLEVIRAFTDDDPNILKKWSCYPPFKSFNMEWVLHVHIAAYMGADFEIVKLFIKLHPESIKMQDTLYGRTPLYWALNFAWANTVDWAEKQDILNNNNNIQTIVYLLNKCPESIMIPTFDNFLPVITAIYLLHELRPNRKNYIHERDTFFMIT